MQVWRRQGIKFLLLPACDECNRALGDKPYFTPAERAAFIEQRLTQVYERQATLWTEDEIREMSPQFQKSIRARRKQLVALLGRVRAAQWRVVRESISAD